MKKQFLTSFAGLSLVVPPLFFLLTGRGDSSDSILYPRPALVLMPMFFGLRWAALAIPTLLFFLWNPRLFCGDTEVPKRSHVLLSLATLSSVLWFIACWKDGLAVQGARYNYSLLAINLVWITVLWIMFARGRKTKQSFLVNLLFHWLLFAWLAWYAFPFFGEMI
jgi:hypothetical protein